MRLVFLLLSVFIYSITNYAQSEERYLSVNAMWAGDDGTNGWYVVSDINESFCNIFPGNSYDKSGYSIVYNPGNVWELWQGGVLMYSASGYSCDMFPLYGWSVENGAAPAPVFSINEDWESTGGGLPDSVIASGVSDYPDLNVGFELMNSDCGFGIAEYNSVDAPDYWLSWSDFDFEWQIINWISGDVIFVNNSVGLCDDFPLTGWQIGPDGSGIPPTFIVPSSPCDGFSVRINVTAGDLDCTAANEGGVIASPTGGSFPFEYVWGDGETYITSDPAYLEDGKFDLQSGQSSQNTVTVTDVNGCEIYASFYIPVSTIPTILSSVTQPICGSLGSIELTAGGVGYQHNYLGIKSFSVYSDLGVTSPNYISDLVFIGYINNNQHLYNGSTETFSIAQGNYNIYIFDENYTGNQVGPDSLISCGAVIPVNISSSLDNIAPTPDVATLIDVTHECSVTSLTAPTATDNCGGAVTVTHNATLPITTQGTTVVTWSYDDGNGNLSTQDQNVVIDDITAPTPDVATLADVTDECSVTLLTAPTATDNCEGTVTVTHNATLPITTQGTTVVTWSYDDGKGNISTQNQNVVINDVTPPSITAPADVNTLANATSCEASGVSLGTETTSDNCGGTVTVTNDAPATYPLGTTTVTWTAMDAVGNTATATQFVTVTSDLAVVTDSIHDALCADSLNGQAFVTVSGGTTAYSFEWDHDGTGDNDDMEDQDGLLAGNYNVVVTDANGCTASTTASVNEPMPLVASNTSVNPTTCTSGDGSVDASVSGGTMPMDYLWDNSEITEDLSGLTAGVYVLVVTDANGCMTTTSTTLSDPAGPVVVLDSIHDNVCFGNVAGELFTTVTGGTGALTYDWDNDGTGDADDADDVSGLAAGTYNLTVVDAAGCTGTTSGTVMDPAVITSTPSTTPVSCFGGTDGTAVLTNGGGTGTLAEDWGTANPSALAAGVTSYTITDDNGCVFNGDVTITQPDSLELTITYNAILCNGDSTDIDVEVVGGTASYSYDWDADGYDDAQDSLGADNGTYTIIVMDANGCTIDSTFTIEEPSAMTLSTVGTDEMNGNDGMIDLTVTGGTTNYTYDWSNSETTEDISGLVAGTYDVIVTDANGCMDSISTTIDAQVSVVENNGIVINVYPNPSNGIINVSFTEVIKGEIKVFDAIGKLVMNQPINELLMEINLDDEERGVYFLIVENENFNKIFRIELH